MYEIINSHLAETALKDIFRCSFNKWGDAIAIEYMMQIDAGL